MGKTEMKFDQTKEGRDLQAVMMHNIVLHLYLLTIQNNSSPDHAFTSTPE